jgi:hypothetical protein
MATKKSRYVSIEAVSGPVEKAITRLTTNLIIPKINSTHITVVAKPLNKFDIDKPP